MQGRVNLNKKRWKLMATRSGGSYSSLDRKQFGPNLESEKEKWKW